MLYFKACEGIEFLSEFDGENGIFLKTFAMSDRRNKNGWRPTWESIKKHIHTFEDNARPGIEYVKCNGTTCDLDHTDGTTKQKNIEVQENFRVTTIVGHTLNHEDHKAFFIHKLQNTPEGLEFYEKVKKKEIEFVSPSVWPEAGGFSILGTMPNGLPKIDVWEWDGLHDAFVTKPAFGDEAKITATCEGENCPMKLLTAKEYNGAAGDLQEKIKSVKTVYPKWTEKQVREKAMELLKDEGNFSANDLAPLQQVPILVRHKDKLRFVSVSQEVADNLQASLENDIAITEESLQRAIDEAKDKSKENTSFSACSCSSNQMDNDTKHKELESKLKAGEESIKELESKLKAMEEEKKTLESKLKAAEENSDEEKVKVANKAKDEAEEEAKQAKKAAEDSEQENKELKAKIAEPLIAKILTPAKQKLSTADVTKLEASLKAKTIPELEEAILMSNLSASEGNSEGVHFDFPDSPTGPLAAKSLEDTFEEVKN